MKKIILSCLFVMGFFLFIPSVYAITNESDVAYFLVYPNGEEDMYESVSMAQAINEKLLYDGYTNENGEIFLENWEHYGDIRIVEDVPKGYTTSQRELRVDLAEASEASIVNYRWLSNPSRGRTILIIFSLIVIFGSSYILNRMNKKSVLLIPIFMVAFSGLSVHAWTNSFVIRVLDEKGDALGNVHVLVYGKPVLEEAYSITLDANGGYFFDGSTSMRVRIPYNGCTYEEFVNSLSDYEYYYIDGNIDYAYRDGYVMDSLDIPENLYNGSVITLNWNLSDSKLYHLIGNGGSYFFYGKTLDSVYIYDYSNFNYYVSHFANSGSHLVGLDTTSSCTRYNQFGISYDSQSIESNVTDVYYLCWNEKPDGIYINGEVFAGNVDSCYQQSKLSRASSSHFSLSQFNRLLQVQLKGSNELYLSYDANRSFVLDKSDEITSFEIVENGESVFYLDKQAFTIDGKSYRISDKTRTSFLFEYFEKLYGDCYQISFLA